MRGLDDINAHKFAQSLRDGEGQGSLVCYSTAATATAKSLQSCLTLCDPMDCSPSGTSIHGDSSGKNTGVGCPGLLQGIFPTQ